MNDAEGTLEVLTQLRALGVQVAIDDFGTGYSSLGYLKRLPVSQIKIDRSFVGDMVAEQSDLAIVRSTVELAHNLGLEVVAEGVEDRPTWDLLAAIGCDTAQGYYMSKPLPADELLQWINESNWKLEQSLPLAVPTARASAELRNLCLPHLMRLRDLSGETARLHAAVGLHRVCLDQVEGGHMISNSDGATIFPLYSGAASKALMAFLPQHTVDSVLEQMAESTSETSQHELRSELVRIKRSGFATTANTDGVASLAAPIRNAAGEAIAALTISGPSYRWESKMPAFAPILVDAAEQISRQLGYVPDQLADAA
jgi:DNA-binding IclR family transcriptional regulator